MLPIETPQFYRFASLNAFDGLLHAISTRHGGVSAAPWATLNLGGSVGDAPTAVDENHERVCAALGIERRRLATAYLTHSTRVAVVAAGDGGRKFTATDALLTRAPGVPLILRFADCVPVVMYDPVRHAVGIAHAGWRGTVGLIAQHTALCLAAAYGSDTRDLCVGIGPSIGPCCFEVGDEVAAQFRALFDGANVYSRPGPKEHIDLWAANRLQLEAVGVRHIEVSGICTACQVADYFSHRADKGRTGRFAAVVGLRD